MKHIDKLFKEKLYNHEVNVPEGLWEKIQPATEDDKGRALLWFWFAGILAILIAGFLYYQLNGTQGAGPLAENQGHLQQQNISNYQVNDDMNTQLVDHEEGNETELDIQNTQEENIQEIPENRIELKKGENLLAVTGIKKNKKSTTSKHIKKSVSTAQTSSSSDKVSTKETFEVNPKPANILITKSYINEEGSVIKQFSNDFENGPTYDVIINSEANDMNAAALLRIVPPIEKLNLPAFHNSELKKKIKI